MESIRSILIMVSCFIGAIFFLLGYVFQISNVSLVGIGILVISISFLFLLREKLVREDLIPNIITPTMDSLSNVINHFGAKGKGIYIPPTPEYRDCRLIVPINSHIDIDRLGLQNFNNKSLLFKDGIILVPLGVGLMQLVEKEMGISFGSKELSSLSDLLNNSIIGLLKVAENVNVNIIGHKIFIQIFNSLFFESCIRTHIMHPNACTQICCPLCSLIACIVAKMTGRYVNIEDSQIDKRERSLNITLGLSKIIG